MARPTRSSVGVVQQARRQRQQFGFLARDVLLVGFDEGLYRLRARATGAPAATPSSSAARRATGFRARGDRPPARRSVRAGTRRRSRPSIPAGPETGRSLRPRGDAAPQCRNSASLPWPPRGPGDRRRAPPGATPGAAASGTGPARAGGRPPAFPVAPRSCRSATWQGKVVLASRPWSISGAAPPPGGTCAAGGGAAGATPGARSARRAPGRRRPRRDHVGQRGAVQRVEVGPQCVVEQQLQAAAGHQRAGAGARVEALDQAEIGLRGPHDVADADARRRLQQAQAAAAPARGLDQALARQVVDHLHQVIFRQAVVLGQFADGHQAGGAGRNTSARAGCSRCIRRVA